MDYRSSVEFSFATWLCGDGAYVSPCSRIAKIHADYAIPVSVTRGIYSTKFGTLTLPYLIKRR